MTPDRDMDRLLEQWLDDGPSVAPDRLIDAVSDRVWRQPQRPAWRVNWRDLHVSTTIKLAASAAVILVAVVSVAAIISRPNGPNIGGPDAAPSPTPWTAPPSASAPSSGAPSTSPEVDPHSADYTIGTHAATIDGIAVSFFIPNQGWEPYQGFLIAKSIFGPQGAEGIVFWAAFPDGLAADPCGSLREPIGVTADLVAEAVAGDPGVDVLTAPVDVTVGGRPAKHVVVQVREDLGCDPGYFYNWKAQTGGALWPQTRAGDAIRVWVVDVDGALLFIGALTNPQANANLEREIDQIVGSIQFE
jgi:hypothetical protein